MCGSMADIQSPTDEIRRGNKKERRKKKQSCTCPHNMVNFGPLTAEIGSGFGAPLQISTGFASWQVYCTASSSGRQPNFAALNRGRHLCSAGRPLGRALAHILVSSCFFFFFFPRLISAVGVWMSTILPHMVWP